MLHHLVTGKEKGGVEREKEAKKRNKNEEATLEQMMFTLPCQVRFFSPVNVDYCICIQLVDVTHATSWLKLFLRKRDIDLPTVSTCISGMTRISHVSSETWIVLFNQHYSYKSVSYSQLVFCAHFHLHAVLQAHSSIVLHFSLTVITLPCFNV